MGRLIPPRLIKPFSVGFRKLIRDLCESVNRIDQIAEDLERVRMMTSEGDTRASFVPGKMGLFIVSGPPVEGCSVGPVGGGTCYTGDFWPILGPSGASPFETIPAHCVDTGTAGFQMPTVDGSTEPFFQQGWGAGVAIWAMVWEVAGDNSFVWTVGVRQTLWHVNCPEVPFDPPGEEP